MSKVFIVVKNVEVHNANASSSYLTDAFPIRAIIGMGDAFRHKLVSKDVDYAELMPSSVKTEAFAIIHEFNLLEGKRSFPAFHASGGPAHKATTPSEIQLSETLSNFKTTLVWSIPFDLDEDINDLKKAFQGFLLRARVAGGLIVNFNDLNVEVALSEKGLQDVLKQQRGWVIKDASEAFDSLTEDVGIEQAVKDFYFTFIEADEEGVKHYERKHKGWYFFNLKGYQFIEQPGKREGSRFGCDHAFAEPVVTLNQLKYFNNQNLSTLFWKWKELATGFELIQKSCIINEL